LQKGKKKILIDIACIIFNDTLKIV